MSGAERPSPLTAGSPLEPDFSAMRFFDGKVPPMYEDPPTHHGQRIVFTSAYARLLDEGKEPEEARRTALGEGVLWRMARVAVGLPDDRIDPREVVDGQWQIRWAFALP